VKGKTGDVAGFMPLQRQAGFIYDSPNLFVIAHELAHGAFNLRHTFSPEELIAAENTTQNLMDYKGGSELWKHQWELIRDPENMLFAWAQDEREGEMITLNSLVKAIRDANLANSKSLPVVKDSCEKKAFSNFKIGEKTMTYMHLICGNLQKEDQFPYEVSNSSAFDWKSALTAGFVYIDPSEISKEEVTGTKDGLKYVIYKFHEVKINDVPLSPTLTDNVLFHIMVRKDESKDFETYLYPPKSNFEKYQEKLFDHEGGYVDDPVDPGGATNKGITLATFEAYAEEDLGIEPTLDNLKNLTNDQASIIYKKRYWDSIKADEIKNGSIAYMLYDFNVNAGVNAAKELQQSLVDLNFKVSVDGVIGDQTIEAVNKADAKTLFDKFKQRRLDFYQTLVDESVEKYKKEHPKATEDDLLQYTKKKFEKGWKDRINSIVFEP